jgi:hypothetical protein
MSNEEAEARCGLDIDPHAGKWKRAIKLVNGRAVTEQTQVLPYWEQVRFTFVELGGSFVDWKEELEKDGSYLYS